MSTLDEIRRRALFQGLMQMGGSLMAASGPSFQPQNAFSRLGQGVQGFGRGVQTSMQSGMQELLLASKLEEAKRKAEQQKRMREAFSGFSGAPPVTATTPGKIGPRVGNVGRGTPPVAALSGAPQSPLQALWSSATPKQRSTAQMYAKMGDYGKAMEALSKRPQGLPTGMTVGPDGRLAWMPGAKEAAKEKALWSRPQVNIQNVMPGLTKQTQNVIQKEALTTSAGLSRLAQIERGYRPEWQRFGTRLNMKKLAVMDKLGQLDPKDKAQLTAFTTFKRDAIGNINLYIKEITGAQLSEHEAARITKGMPNPGTGVFDGDSPTEFEAKMKSTIRSLRMAAARVNYIAKGGAKSLRDVSLEAMPRIIDKRGKAIEAEIRKAAPKMSEAAVKKETLRRLKREFGL